MLRHGRRPTRLAAQGHLLCLRALVDAGANVHADEDGQSPLLIASHSGHVDCVRALLESGADKDGAMQGGWTPPARFIDTSSAFGASTVTPETFEALIDRVIESGGDTDTVAANTGGICGAETGEPGIRLDQRKVMLLHGFRRLPPPY